MGFNGKTGKLFLRVCADNTVYIVDKGNKGITIAHGAFVAGFSKGKWQSTPSEGRRFKLELDCSSSLVVYNGWLTSVDKLVHAKAPHGSGR